MLNLLASAFSVENPKEDVIGIAAPNVAFEPFPALPWLTVGFFIASGIMILLMFKYGKGADYNS